ncbi:SDR family NAD(P)-dependent oxidoreductase [Aliiglaciecola lipolytica]|nr:SDR family oxidoreductase [Aliiglaciecola lipolytica]
MRKFKNKAIFITGAASGIGKETALLFAKKGAILTLCDINDEGLARTVEACKTHTSDVMSLQLDVSDYESCKTAVEKSLSQHGKLDVLCNIAGIVKLHHFTELAPNDWLKMMNINVSSVFYLSQLAMPHLINTQGNIVNVASSAGMVGQAYTSAYCATKAAVVNLSKSLAIEYSAQSVRVNAICPGNVKTPLSANLTFPKDIDKRLLSKMFPLLDAAEASEIASAVAYLASDDARFITGTALVIDGGQTAG